MPLLLAPTAHRIEEEVRVGASPRDVFAVLTDPWCLDRIAQNIFDVRMASWSPLVLGSTYERTLSSHGIPNPQKVRVSRLEQDRAMQTVTTLVGYEVVYSYALEPVAGGTRLSLVKEARGDWWAAPWSGLARHLLTRPEHDGDHLERVRRESESSERASAGRST